MGRGRNAGEESRWKYDYRILRGYVESNPEIRMDPGEVCIPEDLRAGFYHRFDNIRSAIVESWIGSFDSDVYSLSKNFVACENVLSETLHVSIALPQDLASFLRKPKEGLMRLIYNRQFELIQGKIPEADFERMAAGDLAADAAAMFRLGYETWAALAIIVLLEPDKIFGVALDSDNRPLMTEMTEIVFGRQFHHPARRIPEFILHSKKLERYIAFKMPLAREVNAYHVPVEMPTQRLLRNRNGDTSSVLGHRMIFLFVVKDLKEIPVFADLHKRTIHGPDLSIEFAGEQDLSDPEIVGQIQNRLDIMKPRIGGAMVLMDSRSQSFQMAPNMDVISVGLEASGFQPVIEALV